MGKDEALEFLRHMSSDPGTSEKVAAEYKKLLQDLAREKGFTFSEEELVEAARALTEASAGRVTDASVAMVVGGDVEWKYPYEPKHLDGAPI
jgi:hypothetical protein